MLTESSQRRPYIQEWRECSDLFCRAVVGVPSAYVNALYNCVAGNLRSGASTPGFSPGATSFKYIEHTYHVPIIEHVKEFLFNYAVLEVLSIEIHQRRLLVGGTPRLKGINLAPNSDGFFEFELSLFNAAPLPEWKYFIFKSPRRKNYKELDRQVDAFIKQEKQSLKALADPTTIEPGDWINYLVQVVDDRGNPLMPEMPHETWFRVGQEEVDNPLRKLFIGKKIGDSFISSDPILQSYFSQQMATHYLFSIKIVDVVKESFFCFEHFKHHFRLKTSKDIAQKFIEIFSYRNDLSLRRSIIQEALRLILTKHRFDAPKAFVLRQHELLLEHIKENPDYHVYRVQKDFRQLVSQLAERQVKEHLLLDQIAYDDGISVTCQDIKSYLNLTQRLRTREFIYFIPPTNKVAGLEFPIPLHNLRQTCLREKTLNHVIYHLTRK